MASFYVKLPFVSGGGGGGAVDSVNGYTGIVVLTKSDIGLGNVNNTSDANKPVSTAQQTALNGKAAVVHTHPLADLTQSSATSGQVPSWNGSAWVASTPSSGVTDHTLLTNIGTNTHAQIDTHVASTANPHAVTKTQVGLSNVPNVDATLRSNHTGTQTASTISDFDTQVATTALLKANNLSGLTNTVTARTNIGLGNVNNTSDANKPVSTAQAAADTAVQNFAIARANHTGTQALSTLSQSGATTNQVPQWNGSTWVPATVSGGGGGGGGVGGSGTGNYIAKWTASGTDLTNSILFGNGIGIGINNASPNALLHIAAGTSTVAPLKLVAGPVLTTPQAGAFAFDGVDLFFTPSTLRTTLVKNNTEESVNMGSIFIGDRAGLGTSGAVTNAVFIGVDAGNGATNAVRSSFIGDSAGKNAMNASDSAFMGRFAGQNANGSYASNFFGYSAGNGASNAYSSNFFGNTCGDGATNASNSNFFGSVVGLNATNASNSNFFGNAAGLFATNAANSNFFGSGAGSGATSAASCNFFGTQAGEDATSAGNSVFIGHQSGQTATNSSISVFLGYRSGWKASNASNSVLIGYFVGANFVGNAIGTGNIIIGSNISLPNATANGLNIGGTIFGTNIFDGSGGDPSITAATSSRIGIGVVAPSAKLEVVSQTPTIPVITAKAAAAQSADIQQWQNSAGTVLTKVGPLGKLTLTASTASIASMSVPSGTAPTAPSNGDVWFDGTDLKIRIGGVTKTFTVI